MAYVSQERKAALAPKIKEVLKKYGLKGSIAVRHHSTLVVNIKSGAINFIQNYNNLRDNPSSHAKGYIDVNPYHPTFEGRAQECVQELLAAMNEGNHDNSDIQSDYFDVGWYKDVNIGRWDKPYEYTGNGRY